METDVLLENGQGMVIGGLIQEKDSNVQSKVPFFGSLRLIGTLFQQRRVEKSRSEIIFVVIPYVVPLQGDWEQQNAFDVGPRANAADSRPQCCVPASLGTQNARSHQ